MRRVLVIGSAGAGKSTLATQIGERLGLPVVHLDAIYWRPGWVETPSEEWEAAVRDLVSRDAWVMDGNYGGTLELRLPAADTVVFLDHPRLLCLWRVIARRAQFSGRTRPDMARDCPERLSGELVAWVWNYPRTRRPGILKRLAEVEHEKRVVTLRSSAEVERFLAQLVPA